MFDEEQCDSLVVFVAAIPKLARCPQAGGVRKFRWAAKGKGKWGGVRVIDYFYNESIPVFLLDVYAKNVKADLTPAERNALRKRLPLLVQEYQKRRKR